MLSLRYIIAAFNLAVTALALTQFDTNGLSSYGLLSTSTLPKQLGDIPSSWSTTEPGTGAVPVTNVTRTYNLKISRAKKAPDGFEKSVILVNDQFPGPLIEANWGDMIIVHVENSIQNVSEGVTLHWHGQPQRLNPFQDGVPGVTQCPIPPGSSYTYSFRAESYGSSWYHSHVSGQYTDGLYGPMVIYGPTNTPYDIDLGPIMLSDYSHTSYFEILKLGYQFPPAFANVDNNLINGKGAYDCNKTTSQSCSSNAGLANFRFQSGKTHRLRLINTGGSGTQKFQIDGHRLTIIANDYVPLEPYETDVVTLGIGQRTDVLVKGFQNGTSYWMRSDLDQNCLNLTTTISQAKAIVLYPDVAEDSIPTSMPHTWQSNDCDNDVLSITKPYYPISLPATVDTTSNINITVGVNGSMNLLFYVDGSSFLGDFNEPILLDAVQGQTEFDSQRNVYNYGSSSSIRVVVYNYFPTAHPMHLHGHDFWVLASGQGAWNGAIQGDSKNLQRRDTQLLRPAAPDGTPSYIVLQWNADNPGVWPLHCHTSIHASAGLLLNILERSDQLNKLLAGATSSKASCANWNQWTASNLVDQIDSGLK